MDQTMSMDVAQPKERRELPAAVLGSLMVLPALLTLLLLIAYPIVQACYLSLTNTNALSMRGKFIGLDNFTRLFASPEFWASFGNSLIWTLGTTALQLVVGVAFALMLNERIPMRSLARGLIIFPYAISTVVVVLMWQWILNDLYGVANYLLLALHLANKPVNWFGLMPNSMLSVIVIGAWRSFPFTVIVVLARLQTIPGDLYRAAAIDGASAVGRFFDITLPQLRSVLILCALLRVIWDIKEADLILLLTGGGPRIGTQTLPLLIYKDAFSLAQLGRAAAVAVIMLACISVFILLYAEVLRRDARRARGA